MKNFNQEEMCTRDSDGRFVIKALSKRYSGNEAETEVNHSNIENGNSKKTLTDLTDCGIKSNKHDLQRDSKGRIILKSSHAYSKAEAKSNVKRVCEEEGLEFAEMLFNDFDDADTEENSKKDPMAKSKSSKQFKDRSLKRTRIKPFAKKIEKLKDEAMTGANPNISSIASELFRANNFVVSYQNEIYYYDKAHGYFIKRTEIDVEQDLMNQFSEDERLSISASDINKAYKHLLLNPEIQKDLSPRINLPLINCENGVYNVETNELEKHSPQFGFTSYIQARYDENANGKVFKQFLNDITMGNKKSRRLLQEVLGYLLSTYVWAKKAFIFYGVPNSGKSVLLNLISKIVGQDSVCHVDLQKLSNPCYTAKLKNSKLNIAPDLPQIPIKDIGVFKSIVSSLDIIETKELYKNPTSQPCYCKLVFGTNQFVPLNRLDANNAAAFFERLIIVPFLKSIPEEERNLKIADDLFEERDYILTWATKGLKRLIENNFVFSLTKESEETLLSYKARYCLEQVFFNKNLVFKEDAIISRVEVQKQYEVFADRNNLNVKAYDIIKFISLNYPQVKLRRKRINGSKNPIAVYKGLAFAK